MYKDYYKQDFLQTLPVLQLTENAHRTKTFRMEAEGMPLFLTFTTTVYHHLKNTKLLG